MIVRCIDRTGDWWIGLNDFQVESLFRWLNGDILHYTKWKVDSEPDGSQHCVIWQDDNGGTLADKGCGSSYKYVCSSNGMISK